MHVAFTDDPRLRPGPGFFFGAPRGDSVVFAGTGNWNGQPGKRLPPAVAINLP
jgi:hypothetical protein